MDAGDALWNALDMIASKYGLDTDGDTIIYYNVEWENGTIHKDALYFDIRRRVLNVVRDV